MKASEACEQIMSNRRYPIMHWLGEIVETIEAALIKNRAAFDLEFEQVLWGLQIHIYQLFKVDFELRFCNSVIEEDLFRRKVWKKIFSSFGVQFSNDYLLNGANYKRPNKIRKALALAGVDITEKQSVAVCEKYYEITPDQV